MSPARTYDLIPFRLFLDQVIPTARPHLRTILPSILPPMVGLAVFGGWLGDRWTTAVIQNGGTFENYWMILLMFLSMGVYLVVGTALAVASMDAVMERPVEMGRAWRFAVSWRALSTWFLVFVVLGVCFAMCCIPMLVAMPLLSLCLPVMMEEEKFGRHAIRRSSELVWWNGTGKSMDSGFLQASVLLFVGWLIQNAVSGLVQMPMALLQQYQWIRDSQDAGIDPMALSMPLWVLIPTQLLAGLAAAVTWFYWSFGFAMLYREICRRRYAGDLRQAISELSNMPLAPSASSASGSTSDASSWDGWS